jgi:hypothetical protein
VSLFRPVQCFPAVLSKRLLLVLHFWEGMCLHQLQDVYRHDMACVVQEDRLHWEQMGRPNIAANFLSPTMYGSLPKALSSEERLSISRNTPMSASLREVRTQTPVRLIAQTIGDDSCQHMHACPKLHERSLSDLDEKACMPPMRLPPFQMFVCICSLCLSS